MKRIISPLILAGTLILGANANAGLAQDCMLQGTVKKEENADSGRTVFISFHDAKAFSKDARCDLGRKSNLEFKQPQKSLIDTVSPGAKVKFRLQRDENQNEKWQLIDITI